MPAALERKLWKEANSHKNWSDKRKRAYVYGTLRNTGWKPAKEEAIDRLLKKGGK